MGKSVFCFRSGEDNGVQMNYKTAFSKNSFFCRFLLFENKLNILYIALNLLIATYEIINKFRGLA